MSTLTTAVNDVIAALPGRGCSRQAVAKALPDVDPASVVSAIHRLKDLGVLRSRREFGIGVVYTITPGATRPMVGAAHASANNRRAGLNPATPRCAAKASG